MTPDGRERVRVSYKRHPDGPTFYTQGQVEQTPSDGTFALIKGETSRGERRLIVQNPEKPKPTLTYNGVFLGMVQDVGPAL